MTKITTTSIYFESRSQHILTKHIIEKQKSHKEVNQEKRNLGYIPNILQ